MSSKPVPSSPPPYNLSPSRSLDCLSVYLLLSSSRPSLSPFPTCSLSQRPAQFVSTQIDWNHFDKLIWSMRNTQKSNVLFADSPLLFPFFSPVFPLFCSISVSLQPPIFPFSVAEHGCESVFDPTVWTIDRLYRRESSRLLPCFRKWHPTFSVLGRVKNYQIDDFSKFLSKFKIF